MVTFAKFEKLGIQVDQNVYTMSTNWRTSGGHMTTFDSLLCMGNVFQHIVEKNVNVTLTFEFGAVQKCVQLVDLETCSDMNN